MARQPHFRRIADDLRRQIDRGDLKPGDALPTSDDLRARYGVSRATMQAAITELTREGLITGRPLEGRFIAHRPVVTRLARNRLAQSERDAGRGAFLSDAAAGGWTPTVDTGVSREIAPTDVADALGEPDVVVRDRIMSADDQPVMLATSYLPASVAAGTAMEQPDPGDGGIYRRLQDAGYPLTSFTESVTARGASDQESQRLAITQGRPVLLVTRWAYSGDRAVEVNRMVMTADRYTLVYAWPAE